MSTPINFPDLPSIGQIHIQNDQAWKWDGISWKSHSLSVVTGATGPTGADSQVPGPTGPASTVPGPTGPTSTVPGPTGPTSTVPGPTGPTGSPGPATYPSSGIAVSTGTAWGTSKTAPAGDIVGTTDNQILTNKTASKIVLTDGYTEEIFTIVDGTTVNLDPNNGSVQKWTLGANRTPVASNFSEGQSIMLMIDDGAGYTITWSDTSFGTAGVIWKTDLGYPPTLNSTDYTGVILWKIGTQVYGSRIGNA